MSTTPAFARAACWLVAAALHVAALLATGHPPRLGRATEQAPREALMFDVTTEPVPEASSPFALPDGVQSSLAPPEHLHRHSAPMDRQTRPRDHSPRAVSEAAPDERPKLAAGAGTEAEAHFSIRMTSEYRRGPGAQTAATPAVGCGVGADPLPLPEEAVSAPARLANPVAPAYPPEARALELEADVVLAIVVASTGEVVEQRVLKTAGAVFDDEALRAMRSARFIPAQRDGRRVAVRMRWSVSFRLH